jgi:flagellar hook-basal body complex protein FliE
MDISAISGLKGLVPNDLSLTQSKAINYTEKSLFDDFFSAALKVYEQTNSSIIQSEQLYVDLATGKTDDVLAVILAQEKAQASLNFTIQVTGRVIEAYREIMRIQV